MLTQTERAFLNGQTIPIDLVFDARGMAKELYKVASKDLGCILIIGSPCKASGHRLRTRSGHCAQCNTAVIAFQQRSSADGFVYVMHSPRSGLTKVGSSLDIWKRREQLRAERYAGANDWEVYATAKAPEMGKLEFAVHGRLKTFVKAVPYEKEGRGQLAGECFSCSPAVAISELVEIAGKLGLEVKARTFGEGPEAGHPPISSV